MTSSILQVLSQLAIGFASVPIVTVAVVMASSFLAGRLRLFRQLNGPGGGAMVAPPSTKVESAAIVALAMLVSVLVYRKLSTMVGVSFTPVGALWAGILIMCLDLAVVRSKMNARRLVLSYLPPGEKVIYPANLGPQPSESEIMRMHVRRLLLDAVGVGISLTIALVYLIP